MITSLRYMQWQQQVVAPGGFPSSVHKGLLFTWWCSNRSKTKTIIATTLSLLAAESQGLRLLPHHVEVEDATLHVSDFTSVPLSLSVSGWLTALMVLRMTALHVALEELGSKEAFFTNLTLKERKRKHNLLYCMRQPPLLRIQDSLDQALVWIWWLFKLIKDCIIQYFHEINISNLCTTSLPIKKDSVNSGLSLWFVWVFTGCLVKTGYRMKIKLSS